MNDGERFRVRVHWVCGDKTGAYEDIVKSAWVDSGRPNYFWWEEGNASCDCNRANFFGLGEEWPCGETIRITKIEPIDAPFPAKTYKGGT